MPTNPAPYHHGDLRRALIDAALALLAEGRHDFTLREAARRVGVSHAAPYKHFADKRDLLAAVAAEGFEGLRRTTAAASAGHTDPCDRFTACGAAYVRFGLAGPARYRLMFGPALADDADVPGLAAAANAAYGQLRGNVAALDAAGLLAIEPEAAALCAWSFVHGLTSLCIDKPQGNAPPDAAIEGLVRRIVVGLVTPDRPSGLA